MTGKWEEGGQNLKKREGRQYTGSLYKIRILAPLCQLYKETLKVSHPSHYKPTPPPPPPHSWLPPISSKNFPTPPPPLQQFLKNFIPPLWRLWDYELQVFQPAPYLWTHSIAETYEILKNFLNSSFDEQLWLSVFVFSPRDEWMPEWDCGLRANLRNDRPYSTRDTESWAPSGPIIFNTLTGKHSQHWILVVNILHSHRL